MSSPTQPIDIPGYQQKLNRVYDLVKKKIDKINEERYPEPIYWYENAHRGFTVPSVASQYNDKHPDRS